MSMFNRTLYLPLNQSLQWTASEYHWVFLWARAYFYYSKQVLTPVFFKNTSPQQWAIVENYRKDGERLLMRWPGTLCYMDEKWRNK